MHVREKGTGNFVNQINSGTIDLEYEIVSTSGPKNIIKNFTCKVNAERKGT